MAQVTTGELSGLTILVQGGGFAALVFLLKYWFNSVNSRLDKFAQSQNECRLSLPEKYISKHDCEKQMAVHDVSILKIAGKLNGGSAHAGH